MPRRFFVVAVTNLPPAGTHWGTAAAKAAAPQRNYPMNRMIALSLKAVSALVFTLSFPACSGATDDASIGKSRDALGSELSEGDACPAEKCARESVACASPAGTPPLTATNLRCIAGPQTGSGVGVCHAVADCVATR